MAKTPKTETTEAPATEASPYTIEKGIDIPPIARAASKGTTYPFASMAVGDSFFVKAEISDNIKGDDERAKAMTEQCRRLSNRLSGAIRRFKDTHEGVDFAMRRVADGTGVRIWRVKPEA